MKKFHIVRTVESCSPKIRKFKTLKSLNQFIDKFNKKYPNQIDGDNWIDFVVTNVTGELVIYDESAGLVK